MKNLRMLRTTSKRALLDSAMIVCEGNIDEASKLFDLYNERLQLPEEEVIPPSVFAQIKDNASELFVWLKENKDDVVGMVDMVKSVISKKNGNSALSASNAPSPQIGQADVNPLPKI